jgi:hypothetical protein
MNTTGMTTRIAPIACGWSNGIVDTATSTRLRERDRQAYWGWRHDHSDAQLKIEVR